MARPKRVAGCKTAYERMEEAFWRMLAEMPYYKMTGKEVCARASVSHNAFYYYFDNMDDMAEKLFDRLVVPELPTAVLNALGAHMPVAEAVERIPDFELRFQRMRLLAASGSSVLTEMIKTTVKGAWLSAVGLQESQLTEEDQVDLAFVLGGVISLLGSGLGSFNAPSLRGFSEREVGQGVVQKMAHLAQRAKSNSGL